MLNDICPPSIMARGSSTANSRVELIRLEATLLQVRSHRGMYTLVTRFGLPTMENRAELVPLAKKRQVMIPISAPCQTARCTR